MILELHMCGPKGAGQRELIDRALAMMQLDNQFLIEAMLRAGRSVPDLVDDMGLRYRPPSKAESKTRRQRLFHYKDMLDNGWFSCCDAAPWEAAVLTVKYQVPAQAFSTPVSNDGLFHAVYRTPDGVIDPTARFNAKNGQPNYRWEAIA